MVAHPAVTQDFKGNVMALSRQEIQKRSNEKRGIKSKAFSLDADTLALFERLAAQTGKSQVQILKEALQEYAAKIS